LASPLFLFLGPGLYISSSLHPCIHRMKA
jgi:hypothetical protein